MKTLRQAGAAPQAAWQARIGEDPLAHAFAEKVTVHAGMVGEPVEEGRIPVRMSEIFSAPRTERAVLYVHFPYCVSRCTYCGFFGGKYTEAAGEAYVRALKKHLLSVAATAGAQGSALSRLFGAARPQNFLAATLCDLLSTIRQYYPLAEDCEITIEGRIHSLTAEKAAACH